MLFSNFQELSLKGLPGKVFYWIRFALCALPIGSLIMTIYWAVQTSSKNWSTIVNNTILILCIIVAVLSIASFVFILFAALSLLRKLEKVFTYLYFFLTIAAFIVSFVLIYFGNSSHEINYLSKFDKACGSSSDVELTFPTPTIPPPSSTPFATPSISPEPTSTPRPTPTPGPTSTPTRSPSPSPVNSLRLMNIKSSLGKNIILEDLPSLLPRATPLISPIVTPSISPIATPKPTEPPKTFSDGEFCKKHWTSWSRRKYIRIRTIEAKNAFAGIISPWVILFFIEFILMLVFNPPKSLQSRHDLQFLEENNGLIDDNLLPDHQSQTHDADNTHLEPDPIFKDEDV